MDKRLLTLRLLQVYVEVVRQGAVGKAAERLFLTQPAVSLQLRKLQEVVGQPLLENRGRMLQPTAAGKELLLSAERVLAELDDLSTRLSEVEGLARGQFNLAVVTTAQYLAPQLLGGFAKRYPGLDIHLNIGNRQQVITRLQENRDHLYIFSQPPRQADLFCFPIVHNPLVVVASPQHPLAKQQALDFSELLQERFLLREAGSGTRLALETYLQEQGWMLTNSLQVESNEAIRLSVGAGLGIAILSRHTLEASDHSLVELPVRGFPLQQHWYLVWRHQPTLPRVVMAFAQFIEQAVPELLGSAYAEADLAQLSLALTSAMKRGSG